MSLTRKRPLGMEQLESRELFAGDIVVRVINGDLVIKGNETADVFALQQVGPGSYQVTPSLGTTIRGSEAPRTFKGVTDDVFIDTFAGNDRITFGTLESITRLPDDVRIRTGAGADSVLVQRVVGKNATLIMGTNTEIDVDRLTVKSSIYSGAVLLQMGNGNDIANLVNSKALGSLRADGAGGNDTVSVTNGTVGDFTLFCGAGNDSAIVGGRVKVTGQIKADGGPGFDTLTEKPGFISEVSDLSPEYSNFEKNDLDQN